MKVIPVLCLTLCLSAVPARANVNLEQLRPLAPLSQVQKETAFSSTKRSAGESGITLITAKTDAKQRAGFFGAELPGVTYLFAETKGAEPLLIGWQGMWSFPNQDAALASPAFKELKATLEKQTEAGQAEGEFTDGVWRYNLAVGSLTDGRGVLMLGAQAQPGAVPAK